MQVFKIILTVIYFIGSSSNNFFEKNKGNTREGKQKKWTIILGIVLVILCIGLGTIYML